VVIDEMLSDQKQGGRGELMRKFVAFAKAIPSTASALQFLPETIISAPNKSELHNNKPAATASEDDLLLF